MGAVPRADDAKDVEAGSAALVRQARNIQLFNDDQRSGALGAENISGVTSLSDGDGWIESCLHQTKHGDR
jgi:hypothetical protein